MSNQVTIIFLGGTHLIIQDISFGNAKYWPALASGVHAQKWNGSNGGNWSQSRTGENLATSLAVGTAAEKAHENRPPYYALFYIMKIES